MNIPKAIELLQQDLDEPGSVDILDLNYAQELGIEALEYHLFRRSTVNAVGAPLLPSETEE